MTDAHPIVTQNALNFTPDNKRCYAFSGSIVPDGGSSADTRAILFTTQSYYAEVIINWTCLSTSATVDQFVQFLMNDVIIFNARAEDDETATAQSPIELIIPPFTKFEIKVGDNATNPFTVILMGNVYGTIETGYQ